MSEADDFGPDPSPAADMAAMYRRHGIQVVPAFMPGEAKRPGEWKHPILKSWTEYQEALVPDETFAQWYGPSGKYRDRLNMGILTGRCSRNIFVIDLDTYKNAAATNWWNGVMSVHNNGQDLETAEQITGGGGRQKLFQAPNNWQAPTNRTALNVDIRGQGGFAVLAPSMHHTGRQYAWVEGRSPEDAGVTMAPDWLLDEVRMLVEKHGGAAEGGQKRTKNANGEYQGADHDAFRNRTDGREDAMFREVWGIILDWRRASPINPGPVNSEKYAREKYAKYSERTRPQKEYPPGTSNDEALEAEGRGWSVWWDKWRRAMDRWDDKVAEEAAKPSPKQEAPGPEFEPDGQPKRIVLTSAEFLSTYTPPAYLIDGVIQRGYLYSLTARTGHGKTAVALFAAQCIARGQMMHGCKTLPGTVLILAGENPDDVKARFLVLGKYYGFDPRAVKIRWIEGIKHLPSHMDIIRKEAADIEDLVLVLVDTAAAYFPGTETNSNSEQGSYARLLREMTFLRNKPAVVALSHPVKNAARDNMLPMGGSAFLNEVDGNLTLWAGVEGQTTMHWQGKFRGPEFEPMTFELVADYCDEVKDGDGRLLSSVVAKPMSQAEVKATEKDAESDEDKLMWAMHGSRPKVTFDVLADKLGWKRRRVQTVMERLLADKLVTQRRNRKYVLTDKGKEEIGVKTDGKNSGTGTGTDFG